jgi:hypothetical protein
MQVEAERRRWEGRSGMEDALGRGAAVAAGVVLGHVLGAAAQASTPEAPPEPEPVISPEPPPSETGGSSWESDTGQGSW